MLGAEDQEQHMESAKWPTATALLALALVAGGCAQSAPRQTLPTGRIHDATQPVPTAGSDEAVQQESAGSDFNGSWSVQWCDKTDPEADCGGFDIELTQVGDKINGDSFGARVRLAQIDEGGIIHGIAVGNTAVLTIESMRSGGIYLIKATIDGDCMRWKMLDTVRSSERDIDIIATDDVLTKTSADRSRVQDEISPQIDCRGTPIKAQN